MWHVTGIEGDLSSWPRCEHTITFKGVELLLRPETSDHSASVVIKLNKEIDSKKALEITRGFLSALSWIERINIKDTITTGGSSPIYVGNSKKFDFRVYSLGIFEEEFLPEVSNKQQKLALALYREAQYLNSIFYQFLSFYKIINVLYKRDKDQINWINQAVKKIERGNTIRTSEGVDRIIELERGGKDIGKYLYVSCRCAVAHANPKNNMNPESLEDEQKLQNDMPIIKRLAEYFIENELGIKSEYTLRNEHLYELDGFRKIFGGILVAKLKSEKHVSIRSFLGIPNLSIRFRREKQLNAFRDLNTEIFKINNGVVTLKCTPISKVFIALIKLDFVNEGLVFNPMENMLFKRGDSIDLLTYKIDWYEFSKGFYCNRQLEIYDSSGKRMSRTGGFVPENIDINGTFKIWDDKVDYIKSQLAYKIQRSKS
ncbi:MAG: hypothetical protein HY094_03925 [Candidatus Melainabacteria bacterium]|nr:hypothetical protein [Candidatus Melainabacteria bacterium]